MLLAAAALLITAPNAAVSETAISDTAALARTSHYIKNAYTGNCLEGHHGTGDTGWVGARSCQATYYQTWNWTGVIGQGYTTLIGNGAQRCLDSNDQGHVYMLDCNGGGNQAWRVYVPGSGLPIIVNFATSDCLMEYPPGTMRTADCNLDQQLQRWRFVR